MRFGVERRTTERFVGIVVLIIAICGVSFGQTSPSPAPVEPASNSLQHATPAQEAATPAGDSSIRLGSGDLIEVSVYDVPEMATKTRVNDTGEIYLPLISYVHVEGLTVADAEKVIEQRLKIG